MTARETLADRVGRIRHGHNVSFSEALRVAQAEIRFEQVRDSK